MPPATAPSGITRQSVGQLIKLRRRDQRMREHDLAKAAGVAEKTIYNIERGQYWPSLPMYFRICQALGFKMVPLAGKS